MWALAPTAPRAAHLLGGCGAHNHVGAGAPVVRPAVLPVIPQLLWIRRYVGCPDDCTELLDDWARRGTACDVIDAVVAHAPAYAQ